MSDRPRPPRRTSRGSCDRNRRAEVEGPEATYGDPRGGARLREGSVRETGLRKRTRARDRSSVLGRRENGRCAQGLAAVGGDQGARGRSARPSEAGRSSRHGDRSRGRRGRTRDEGAGRSAGHRAGGSPVRHYRGTGPRCRGRHGRQGVSERENRLRRHQPHPRHTDLPRHDVLVFWFTQARPAGRSSTSSTASATRSS